MERVNGFCELELNLPPVCLIRNNQSDIEVNVAIRN